MKRRATILILVLLVSLLAGCGSSGPASPAPTPTAAPTSTLPPPATATAQPAAPPTATELPATQSPPATATTEPTAPAASATEPAAEGRIAFYSNRDGNPEIYIMNADGSGLVRLTDDPGFDDSPALSPDGTRVAFLTARHDPDPHFPDLKYEIYLVDVDGGNQRRLTITDAAEDHPAWSPDGTRLLFDADYDGDGFWEIYVLDLDSGDVTRLTENQANDQFADWSPDGSRIAFASDRAGNWDLYVMDADGSEQQPLTDSPDWELFPAWSPDGTQIAFNGLVPRSRNTDVYVMDADGGGARRLTEASGFDENPAWSPDGSQILFQAQRGGYFDLYVMDADGGRQRPLAAHPGDDLWPSWAPASGPAGEPAVAFQQSPQQFDERGTFQAGLGDLDGDGDLDAVFANPQTHDSGVWLNDGGGTLVDTGQRLTQYGHGVAVADFDGDGDLDAFVVCHQFITPSRLYLNDGTGRLEDSGQDLGDAGISANEVNLLDLNGDGFVDVHVLYYDPGGLPDRVYLNDGAAHFADSGLALDEETIAWGDLDGDGDVDYFGKRWGQGYVVQLNDGGRFSPGWQMEDEGANVGGVALADFDGDGDLDALVANGFRSTGGLPSRLLWNDGHGAFADSGQRLNETVGADLGVGDLDGDGDPDVFVANMDLPNEVWLNDGGRLVDSGLRLGGVPPRTYATKPSLGDLDGDGDLDVFVANMDLPNEVWLNDGGRLVDSGLRLGGVPPRTYATK
ncbi:MAG: FG-GAP-like repeat-containing protein, partial [Anaerolineae bacterium]